MNDIVDLKNELKETKERLEEANIKHQNLQKALWDMLNYANMFVLLLGSKMEIKLINWSLATTLGFKKEEEPIGKNWLDFIKPEDKKLITNIHHDISRKQPEETPTEITSDVVTLSGDIKTIQWFNTFINHEYNMTFSFGVIRNNPPQVTEESIRSYYRNVIQKDKTMIKSLRDAVVKLEVKNE